MARRPTIAYQPALDGVRALAVIAVLLFHAEVPGVTGGYLGVSVFFTLSGFLITSLLVTESETTGRVDARAFYARRARRLLPASVVCIASIVLVAALTDVFDGVADLRRHVIGSLLQVANWVFLAGDGSYQELFAQASGAVSPLEHYWSLAIEEQFYWVWPLAFLGLARVAPDRRSRIVWLGALTAGFAVAAPVIAAVWGGDAAYWATPARAAEILVGALLAVVVAGRTVGPRWALLAPVALVALVVAVVTFPTAGGPAYAGALPLVGVLSAALLLGLQADGPVRRLLSTRPLVRLGLVSYGVYLYHWPVFVILDEQRTGLDGPALVAVRLAVTLLIAEVSFALLERPIRRASWIGAGRTLGWALGATVAVAVAAVAVVPASVGDYWLGSSSDAEAASIEAPEGTLAPLVPLDTGSPTTSTARPTASAPTTAPSVEPTAGPTVTATPTTTDAPATTIAPVPVPSRPVRIVVAGDSTAAATGAGLVTWAAANPQLAQVELAAEPGCGFVRGGELLVDRWVPVDPRCDRWLDEELPELAVELAPDAVVLMTTSWDVIDRRWDGGDPLTPLDDEFHQRLHDDVAAATQRFLDAGVPSVVWIREPVPNVYWWDSGQPQEDPARHAVVYAAMDAAAASDPRVHVVDLPGWLAATGLDVDQAARPDGVHWTPEASERIADEFLGEQVLRAVLLGAPGG